LAAGARAAHERPAHVAESEGQGRQPGQHQAHGGQAGGGWEVEAAAGRQGGRAVEEVEGGEAAPVGESRAGAAEAVQEEEGEQNDAAEAGGRPASWAELSCRQPDAVAGEREREERQALLEQPGGAEPHAGRAGAGQSAEARGGHRSGRGQAKDDEALGQQPRPSHACRQPLLQQPSLLLAPDGAHRRHQGPEAEGDRQEAVGAPLHVAAEGLGVDRQGQEVGELRAEHGHLLAEAGPLGRRVAGGGGEAEALQEHRQAGERGGGEEPDPVAAETDPEHSQHQR
jgi:hypothetical protein